MWRVEVGDSVTDRNSVFISSIGYPVKTANESRSCISQMKQQSCFSGATHLMSSFISLDGSNDKDDDGEANGGSRIRGTLRRMKGKGFAVVVARWYGGENLGKIRFQHIENCIRSLMDKIGFKEGMDVSEVQWMKSGSGNQLGASQSTCCQTEVVPEKQSKKRIVEKKREEMAEAATKRMKQAADELIKKKDVVDLLDSE